ncbi:MAG: BrnA antitoxin family protein [Hyphomicrobiaceae bacterium]|nr:BrnA antitoxin family protein [Hyphomicrobiaceae bacterium]
MNAKYSKPMTAKEISAVKDEDIDLSDIPELDDAFWREARKIEHPMTRKSVHLKLDEEVFEYFKRGGKGHISRMQAVLRAYVDAKSKKVHS